MKKLLMMAALAGFAFASCTNDNEESYEANKAPQRITFASPVMYGNTRANIVDAEQINPYDKKETFKVFGVNYTPNDWSTIANEYGEGLGEEAFYNQSLKGWDTQAPHFWKDGKDYAFAAYSPNIVEGTAAYNWTKGLTITDYVTPAIAQQYDMMYAPAVFGLNGQSELGTGANGNQYGYNGVNLTFKHALSSVHFRVCVHEKEPLNESNFMLNSIKLVSIKNQGTFAENMDLTTPFKYEANPEWTAQTGNAEYSFVDVAYQPTRAKFEAAQDVQVANAKNHIAFMVPQTLSGEAKIVIDYDVTIGKETKKFVKEIFLNAADLMPVTSTWEMGKRYTYTIALTASNRIYFAPTVTDWEDVPAVAPNAPIVL